MSRWSTRTSSVTARTAPTPPSACTELFTKGRAGVVASFAARGTTFGGSAEHERQASWLTLRSTPGCGCRQQGRLLPLEGNFEAKTGLFGY